MSKGKKLPGYLQQRGKSKILHVVFWCGAKQVWRSTRTSDPKQADRIARAIMAEHEQIAAGLKPAEKDRAKARMTCADAMERYDSVRTQNRSHKEDARVRRLWTAHLGSKRLSEVVPSDLESWRAGERARGRAAGGINRDWSYFQCIFSLARADRLTDNDPFRGLKKLKPAARVRWLTREELARLKAVMRPEDYELVVIACRTGLRQDEQFSLRREDVNFQTGLIFVRDGKTGSRHVPMPKAVREILERRLSSHRSGWVFPDQTGRGQKHQSAKNFYTRRYRPACEAAGIEDATWHDLRHTFCSHLVQAGVPLYEVGTLAGHSNPKMTQRYAHLAPSHLVAAVSIFDVWDNPEE